MSGLRLLICAGLISLGVAAVAGAGIARYALDSAPGIASVRLTEIVAEHMAGAARDGSGAEETAAATRAWAGALEDALAAVAERHNAVLLPIEAVAFGAPDLTAELRAEIAQRLSAPKAPESMIPAQAEARP